MDANEVDWLAALANASYLRGTFFFSILLIVVTRTAHKYYAEVNERVDSTARSETSSTGYIFS